MTCEQTSGHYDVTGQAQGLLSVPEQSSIRILAGLHTGPLPLRVELHQQDPGLQPGWEEVVEASFTPHKTELTLGAFEQFEQFRLQLGT